MRRRAGRLLAAAILAALADGCSGNAPQIARVSAQLLYVDDLTDGSVHEELALHVVPEDKDGLDDLQYLHLISDKAELYWSLSSDTWSQAKSQNDQWIGSARLAMPRNERFPRGEYRVLLYDLSGDSAEQRFDLDTEVLDPREIPFPQAAVVGGRITLTGALGWYAVLVYTGSNTYVKSFAAQAEGVSLDTIRRSDSVLRGGFSYYVYAYWSRRGVGLLVGPYFVD